MSLEDNCQILKKLIECGVKHGKAVVTWQDGHIVKIEKIETDSTITK